MLYFQAMGRRPDGGLPLARASSPHRTRCGLSCASTGYYPPPYFGQQTVDASDLRGDANSYDRPAALAASNQAGVLGQHGGSEQVLHGLVHRPRLAGQSRLVGPQLAAGDQVQVNLGP